MATRHVVDRAENMPTGSRRIITVGRRSILVIARNGEFFAVKNVCPHHGASLEAGTVEGTMIPAAPQRYELSDLPSSLIIRCPWHGFEFRLSDGCNLARPRESRVKTYDVAVEDDEVVLYV